MISVFSNTANSTEELAGLGYPILDNWCKSATLFATLNGEQYIKLEIPHKAFAIDRKKLPNGRDILKIIDMDDEEDYYRVRKPKFDLKTTTIIAEHISADLIDNLIEDINIVNANGSEAMAKIKAGTQYTHPFDFRSNIMSTANIRIVRMNPLQALIGTADNTFVKRFGGELRRRRFTLTVNDRIGVHRTGTIRSKKDLTGFESEVDWDAVATRIMPKGPNGVLIPEKYVDSPLINKYEHPIIKVIEYHVEYEGDFKDLPKSEKERVYNELRAAAKKSFSDGIDLPTAMYTIDFTNLQKTEEYKDYEALEKYSLGDTVDVYESSHDLFVTTKILYIEWDILKKKYLRMILGNIKDGIVRGSINKSAVSSAKAERAEKIANFALASADGKTTNYYGYAKPDNPQKGDLWYKRNGDEDEIWQWQEVNGKYQWVYLLGTAQTNQIKREFESKTQEINQSIATQTQQTTQALRTAGANASAIEATKGAITKLNQGLTDAKTDLTQAQSQLSGSISQIRSDIGAIRTQQSIYEQSNTQNLARITGQLGDKANSAEVKQTADKIREEIASQVVGGRNLIGVFNTHCFKSTFDIDTYRFAEKTEKNANTNSLKLQFLWEDGSYTYIASIDTLGTFHKAFKIKKPYKEFIIKFNSDKEDAKLICRDSSLLKLNEDYLFSGVLSKLSPNDSAAEHLKIEKGTLPSDWSKAPEDVESLITEAKATFERTAQGLRTDLIAVQSYVSADGARTEALRTYSREETARQLTAERKAIEAGYVGKATYAEDVKGISRRFEELKSSSETKLAEYRQTVDGQFTTISQQIAGKASQTEFQRVQETSKLYERLIGTTEDKIKSNLARMTMTDSLFQAEVSKVVDKSLSATNYVTDPYTMENFITYNPVGGATPVHTFEKSTDGSLFDTLVIDNSNQLSGHRGVTLLPLDNIQGLPRKLYLSVKVENPLKDWINLTVTNRIGQSIGLGVYKEKGGFVTYVIDRYTENFNFGIPLFLHINRTATEGKKGIIKISKPAVSTENFLMDYTATRFDRQFGKQKENTDKAFTSLSEKITAVSTIQTQLAGSWSVKNLNSSGDVLSQINLTDGNVKIAGKLVHITGQTLIDDAVITSAKIKDLSADKITAGTLNAARVNVINLNASNVTSGTFIGLTFKGGKVESLNGSMIFDLQNNVLKMTSDNASIQRVQEGVPTQFIRYRNAQFYGGDLSGEKYCETIIGSNRNGTMNIHDSTFAGIVIQNPQRINIEDKVYLYGDSTLFRHNGDVYGWEVKANTQVIQPSARYKESAVWSHKFVVLDKYGGAHNLIDVIKNVSYQIYKVASAAGKPNAYEDTLKKFDFY